LRLRKIVVERVTVVKFRVSLLCLNVWILCLPNIMSLDICLQNCTSSKLARLLDTASKFVLFSVSGLKDEQLVKANLHEN